MLSTRTGIVMGGLAAIVAALVDETGKEADMVAVPGDVLRHVG